MGLYGVVCGLCTLLCGTMYSVVCGLCTLCGTVLLYGIVYGVDVVHVVCNFNIKPLYKGHLQIMDKILSSSQSCPLFGGSTNYRLCGNGVLWNYNYYRVFCGTLMCMHVFCGGLLYRVYGHVYPSYYNYMVLLNNAENEVLHD